MAAAKLVIASVVSLSAKAVINISKSTMLDFAVWAFWSEKKKKFTSQRYH